MESNKPFNEPVSKKEFNGFWITKHDAKVIKTSIKNNNAPFLPDENGQIKAEAIFNATTGYCIDSTRLIQLQIKKQENGYNSNIVATKSSLEMNDAVLNPNEKGVFYNFKAKDGKFHSAAYFFPEQTSNPESIRQFGTENIKNFYGNQSNKAIAIDSSNPEEYLAKYFAACRSGAKLTVSQKTASEFKDKMMIILNDELMRKKGTERQCPSLNTTLFNAGLKSNDVIKSLKQEKKMEQTPQTKKPARHRGEDEYSF